MSDAPTQYSTRKQLKVGLGEALQRLMKVELRLMNGFSHVEDEDLIQRQLIIDSLNLTQLDLGFDCNDDDVPDTADIFEKAAQTSCCRIIPESQNQKKVKGKSRSQTKQSQAPEVQPDQKPAVPQGLEFYDVTKDKKAEPQSPSNPEQTSEPKKKKGLFGGLFG
jgi:hypothetical protein